MRWMIIEVIVELAHSDEAFAFRLFQFRKNAPFAHAADGRLKHLTETFFQKFGLLVLDAGAFGFGGTLLGLRAVLGRSFRRCG